jgi:hypothetical protein
LLSRPVVAGCRSHYPPTATVCAPSVRRSPFGFACVQRSHKKMPFFFCHFRCAEWERSGVASPINIPKDNVLFNCFVTIVLRREKFNVNRTLSFRSVRPCLAHFAELTIHVVFRRVLKSFSSIIRLGAIRLRPEMWVISCTRVRGSSKVIPGFIPRY